jgi:hypothetical protein
MEDTGYPLGCCAYNMVSKFGIAKQKPGNASVELGKGASPGLLFNMVQLAAGSYYLVCFRIMVAARVPEVLFTSQWSCQITNLFKFKGLILRSNLSVS